MIKHLACIMDGNRRWAKKHGLFAWEGHKEGLEAAKRVIQFCLKESIPYLSLWLFSIENFKRSAVEKDFIFRVLPSQMADSFLDLLKKENVRVRFIGDRTLFPASMKPFITRFETETAAHTGLQLNMLFCYGGRQELVDGVKQIARQFKHGEIQEQDITEDFVGKSLWTGSFPAPDMVVRTSGLTRMSNFLLYQAAYSEWYFLDCLWPDIQEHHLRDACGQFNKTQRNFGA